MKKIHLIACCMMGTMAISQNNLLDTSTWTVGNGNVGGFSIYGPTAENQRILDTDPKNNTSVVWISIPDTSTSPDGGYYSPYVAIDPTKTYRLTTWMKKTGSDSGTSFFGLHSMNGSTHTSVQMNGTVNSNPYFWNGDLPELDKWYLIVAFIHPSSYSGASQGAMYDGGTGQAVAGMNVYDFKFAPNATTLRNRALLWKTQNSTDRQYYWEPTIYEVNGQEPTIAELITSGGNTSGEGGDTVWNSSGNDINYSAGNVGIGTTSPDEALTVKGKIHAEEVRVDLSVPAPDYVFKEEYRLNSLEEVQRHIDEHGHLPNIPSAKEMETNGVELGTMDMRLLEKIEELTLYILEQEKRIQELEKRIKQAD